MIVHMALIRAKYVKMLWNGIADILERENA
jgi:hypothetical protein